MKKYINLLLIFILTIVAFTSCDTDATHGILHNIANSEKKEKFEIKAATFDTTTNAFYSIEVQDKSANNGIYKTKTDSTKNPVLNSKDYPQMKSIYTDGTYIYFNYYSEEDDKTKLKQLKISDSTKKDITFDGSFVELTTNGFLITKDDTDYIFYKLVVGTLNYTKAADKEFSIPYTAATEGLSTIIVVGDELILQTVNESSKYSYYKTDGTKFLSDQDKKIVAANKKDATNYYLVLSDGAVKKLDSSNDSVNSVYTPSDDKKLSLSDAKKLIIDNHLFVINNNNDVYSYDLTPGKLSDGYTTHTEGFASQLKLIPSVVEVFEYDNSKDYYYIATNSNGFYKLEVTSFADIDDSKIVPIK